MTEALAVRHELVVQAPLERCFRVFTSDIGTWWPLSTYSIGKSPAASAAMDDHVGGRWYEVGEDGSQCSWGHIKVWEPPTRVVLGWEIGADWQPDPAATSEVEVTFAPEGDDATRVVLVHSGLEYYGDAADSMRDAFGSDTGWRWLLEAFAEKV